MPGDILRIFFLNGCVGAAGCNSSAFARLWHPAGAITPEKGNTTQSQSTGLLGKTGIATHCKKELLPFFKNSAFLKSRKRWEI